MSNQTQAKDDINLKETLNLPKTEFPMRANLAQNEPQRLKVWDKNNIYETVIAEFFYDISHFTWRLIITPHFIWKSSVRMNTDCYIGNFTYSFYMWS